MKKIIMHCAAFLMAFNATAQITTIYTNDFSAGGAGWTLGQGGNFDTWIVNNNYSCASTTPNQGGGNYMHIYDDLGGDYCAHCGFYGSGSAGLVYATMTSAMVTTGLSNITISFDWLCQGQTGPLLASYGTIDYSIDGGINWINIINPLARYSGQSTWATSMITSTGVPALANQADLRIRFGFTNSGYGTNPAFSIDNILITSGTGSTGIKNYAIKNGISIFPNPSKGNFNIYIASVLPSANVIITDAIGNKISSTIEKINDQKIEMNLLSFVPGVYFVTVNAGNETITKKLIISE